MPRPPRNAKMEIKRTPPHAHHDEVWLLLSWYVNGSLEGAEFALVEQHLKVCITCRKEFAIQQRTARAIHDSCTIPLSSGIAFAQLQERIAKKRESAARWARRWDRCRAICSDAFKRLPNMS